MPRNPEYQYFLDSVNGVIPDELPPNRETKATQQEIGWWKQWQMARAIRHFRSNTQTREEKNYLRNHWDGHPINLDKNQK